MDIRYKINTQITPEQFRQLLIRSTLAERRPVDNTHCLEGMISNSNLVCSAWHNDQLVGIARSMTDFHYACYLSDLAIDKNFQHQGIGKALQRLTQEQLGEHCKLILIAAPAADQYYQKIGFQRNDRCWVLNRDEKIKP